MFAVIDFHKTTYVPQNITVVVTGRQIDPVHLLDTISRTTERDIEKAGLARGPHPQNWTRPFLETNTVESHPTIEKDKVISLPYSSNDTSGQITISFIGPGLQDSLAISALGVLGDYLASSPHSILNHDLVEITEPACAGECIYIASQKLSSS